MTEETYSNRKEDTFITLRRGEIVASEWTPRYRVVNEIGTGAHYASVERLRRHVIRGGEKRFFWVTVERLGVDDPSDIDHVHRLLSSVLADDVGLEERVLERDTPTERPRETGGIVSALRSIF